MIDELRGEGVRSLVGVLHIEGNKDERLAKDVVET